MNAAVYILMAVMAVVCALLVLGARWVETRYYRNHPPNDGCTEMKFDDEEEDDWP